MRLLRATCTNPPGSGMDAANPYLPQRFKTTKARSHEVRRKPAQHRNGMPMVRGFVSSAANSKIF
jgi:hypothetical protein